MKKKKRGWHWGLYLLLSPFLLLFLMAILIYLPPVQRFVVNKVVESLEENLGVNVTVDKIRLAFPLDLAVHQFNAVEEGDTLANVGVMRLSVPFWPLLKGIVEVDGLELYEVQLNTGKWLPDLAVRGKIGKLAASTHGIDLKHEQVHLDAVRMSDAALFVLLSDTAVVTEKEAPSKWKILVPKVDLERSRVRLSLPGDSMRIDFGAQKMLLRGGAFDLGKGSYAASSLNLYGGEATYVSIPSWNDGRKGNQAYSDQDTLIWTKSMPESEGIDPNYIQLSQLKLALKDFRYEETGRMAAEVSHLGVVERSGLNIKHVYGKMNLDGDSLSLSDWTVRTPSSLIQLEAQLLADSLTEKQIPDHLMKLKAQVSTQDLQTLGKGFVAQNLLEALSENPLEVEVNTSAEHDHLAVDTLGVHCENILNLEAKGEIWRPGTAQQMGKLNFDLHTSRPSFYEKYLRLFGLTDYQIPAMSLAGKVQCNGSQYALALKNRVAQGVLSLNGNINLSTERYQAELTTKNYPLQDLVSVVEMKNLSTTLNINGRGFNPLLTSAKNDLEWTLDSLQFAGWQLGNLRVSSHSSDGKGQISFGADNDLVEGEGLLDISLGEKIAVDLHSSIPTIALAKLMDLKHTLTLGTTFSFNALCNRDLTDCNLGAKLENTYFVTEDKGIPVRDIKMKFGTSPQNTSLKVSSGDLELFGTTDGTLDTLLKNFGDFAEALALQISTKALDQEKLKAVAPAMDIRLSAGKQNLLFNVCRELGYVYESLNMNIGVSKVNGVNGKCQVSALKTGSLVLDTIALQLRQDTTGLVADGWVKNFKKRNKTKFEANLRSYLLDTGAGAEIKIRNHDGVVGMDFGVIADLNDGGINVRLYPENPTIAFRKFTVNKDNYFRIGKDSLIDSNIDLLAEDGTGLRIYSQPSDSVNDLTVSLNRLNLGALSQGLPYLPALQGLLSSDLHIVDDGDSFSAMAMAEVEQLVVEEAPLGNIGLEAIYLPKSGSKHYANVYISTQGNEVLTLGGTYSSEGEQKGYEGSVELMDFPLELLNGFLSGMDVAMSGTTVGKLDINGKTDAPSLNGAIIFQKARLYSDVYGFDFNLDDKPVTMVDNQLILSDYRLSSQQNSNPLHFDGMLDMRDLSDIQMDFRMSARNFELINTKKKASSIVYGKVYADFDGAIKGHSQDLTVRGKLSILDRTDMTYILKDSPLTVDDRLHDLVQFVDFEETATDEEQPVVHVGNFNMTLAVNISDAALFHCNLSEDGSNYVDLEGGGELTLRLTQQGEMRLTGRFTANSGEMKYSLPVIPLKTFKLVQGSYVDFTGDVVNPTLNIAAKERVKAVVTDNDQPRTVAFDVGVSITQPLERMGLEFTIDAPEDLAVQNQLAAMTKAERGKAAVGMLVTGLFITDESINTAGTGFKASNALTAFLQSEIQSIAGSALKTIDVTIGMENNTTATGNTTTDYSFQFAKRFWGNRIAVIIGGKVSTGAEAENSAESFIDNIAVEYRLDKTASRYVKVFYERGFQDPLEGQLTKTGAGLVLRRKSDKLGDLFIFRNKNSNKK